MLEKPFKPDKDIDEIVRILRGSSVFKGLSSESLKIISEKFKVDLFVKNSAIIKEGWPGIDIYFIKSGSVRVMTRTEDGNIDHTITNLKKGGCLDEMSMITGEHYSTTVKANEDSLLYYLTKGDFDKILSEEPLIYEHFQKIFTERANRRNIQSAHLKEFEIELNRHLQKVKHVQYTKIVGNSRKMKELLLEADNYSKNDIPITLIGEAGTGRELLARKIHRDSERAENPIIEIILSKDRKQMAKHVYNDRRRGDCIKYELHGNETMLSIKETGNLVYCLELADKGTLIIKEIENMDSSVQEKFMRFIETGTFPRIGGGEFIRSNVRIIVTTKDLDLMRKQLDEKLFCTLTAHKLNIPPLRERKKDIPYLIEHFVNKICKTEHTKTKDLSEGAKSRLLSYDYPGNIRELETAIMRAISISNGNSYIEEEEIFLGDTNTGSKNRINLLDIPMIKGLCKSTEALLVVKIFISMFLISILYFTFIHHNVLLGGRDIALILCWQIGLPLIFIIFLFAGRFGCSLCPMTFISRVLDTRLNLKLPVPAFIKRNDDWIMGMGFIFIIFIENHTHIENSVIKTVYLLLSLSFAAIIVDSLFGKSTWCRHVCPLGGMSGYYAMSSLIEIRANKNICVTMCKTFDCYKGSEDADPCPMYLHLQFLDDNRVCKVCLNCIKSCKHNATQLNLRIPGDEICSLKQPSLVGAIISIILGGLLFAEIFCKLEISQVSIPFIFIASILFILSLGLISNYCTSYISTSKISETLRYYGYTVLPITLFGYIAFKLTEVFGETRGVLSLLKIYNFDFNFTYFLQTLLVITGLFITEYLIYKVTKDRIKINKQYQVFAIQGAIPLILSIIYISLFSR